MKKYVPRSIQNIFDRVEAFNESITEKLFSEPLPTTFEVIVYASKNPETRIPPTTNTPGDFSNIDKYFYFKARSLSGHHDHLTRPETATTIDQYEKFRNAHFQAIIKKNDIDRTPQTGEVWLATETGADLVTLVSYQRSSNIVFNLTTANGGPARSAHSSGGTTTSNVGNYQNYGPPLPTTGVTIPVPNIPVMKEVDFVNKIKNSPSFAGWSGPALAGVIANARAESSYKQLVGGDEVRFYENGFNARPRRVSEKRMSNVRKRNINGYCSWGYWQLNICPDNAAGKQLVNDQGIDIATEAGKKDWIKKLQDDEFQFAFVAKEMAKITKKAGLSAWQAGYDITMEFEKPADTTNHAIKRGELAEKIYKKYKATLDK